MKKMTLIAALSASLLLACSSQNAIQSTAAERISTDDDDALYRQRFAALTDKTSASGLPAYDTLVGVSGAQRHSPLPVRGSDGVISDDAILQSVAYAQARNSAALLVWQGGALREAHYFGRSSADSLIVSKSLAKPLSVIAVGRAIMAGHIPSLDAPVADFFHEWRDTPKAAMTIRHLLSMRSGLLPQGAAPDIDDVLNKAYLHPRHDEIIINDYPLVDTPGVRYEYSNANSELVAPLIERATGIAYEDWVAQEVLTPIGAAGGQVWMNRIGGTPHSGCCWLLPAETYLRLAILLINDGEVSDRRLLPEGFVRQMLTVSPQNPHAGLGLYVAGDYTEWRGPLNPTMTIGRNQHSEPYLADDLYLFDGNSNQVVYIVPSADLIVARFGNRPSAEAGWDNSALPNMVIRGLSTSLRKPLQAQPLPVPPVGRLQ